MIGWWIVVSTQTPHERDQADQESRRAAILAQWEAGAEGLRWIDALVERGLATKLSSGGYPNRYTARAAEVIPQLRAVPPADAGVPIIGDDYVTSSGWRGDIELNEAKVANCDPLAVLTIDAWDQS